MINTKAQILLNQKIAEDHFKMVLRVEGLKESPRPGQFFHIRSGTGFDPLLRRPISLHRLGDAPDIIEILYKVVGRGTHLMSRRSKGTFLDIIGPLGNGFKIDKMQKNFIIIAGGMGVAPLMALCDELAKFRKKHITVILAAKNANYIVGEQEFKNIKASVLVVTEDGSQGIRGLATDVLVDVIKKFDLRDSKAPMADKHASAVTIGTYHPLVGVYTCGCMPMLKEISKICTRYKLRAQASLEERMGCGVGACLGCVVNTTSGYKRVCKDGPVFDLNEVVF